MLTARHENMFCRPRCAIPPAENSVFFASRKTFRRLIYFAEWKSRKGKVLTYDLCGVRSKYFEMKTFSRKVLAASRSCDIQEGSLTNPVTNELLSSLSALVNKHEEEFFFAFVKNRFAAQRRKYFHKNSRGSVRMLEWQIREKEWWMLCFALC